MLYTCKPTKRISSGFVESYHACIDLRAPPSCIELLIVLTGTRSQSFTMPPARTLEMNKYEIGEIRAPDPTLGAIKHYTA